MQLFSSIILVITNLLKGPIVFLNNVILMLFLFPVESPDKSSTEQLESYLEWGAYAFSSSAIWGHKTGEPFLVLDFLWFWFALSFYHSTIQKNCFFIGTFRLYFLLGSENTSLRTSFRRNDSIPPSLTIICFIRNKTI